MSRQDEVEALLTDAMNSPRPRPAPGDPGAAPAPDPVRIASVDLAVRDLDATARFYREVIGLHTIDESPGTAALGAGGRVLITLQHRPAARPDDDRTAGLYHTAFLLPGRDDLGAWLLHTGRHGHRLDGAADHLVSEAMYLHDPEGNGVEVYVDRPRSAWTWRDGRIEMANSNPDFAGIMASATQDWVGAPPGTTVGHVHLRVGDVAQAAAFYTAALGLTVVRERGGGVFMSSGGYHHHIAGNVWHSAGAGMRDPGMAGLLAVLVTAEGAAPRRLQDPWGTVIEVAPPG